MIFTLSGNFPYCLESFSDFLESFHAIWKVSSLTAKFSVYLKSLEFVWKVSGKTNYFQPMRNIFTLSENFTDGPESIPDCLESLADFLENFQLVWNV